MTGRLLLEALHAAGQLAEEEARPHLDHRSLAGALEQVLARVFARRHPRDQTHEPQQRAVDCGGNLLIACGSVRVDIQQSASDGGHTKLGKGGGGGG